MNDFGTVNTETGEVIETGIEASVNWRKIGQQLAAPFPPEAVNWRPQGKPGKGAKVQVVAYVDARDIQDRLDAVVGVGGWSFTLQPLHVDAQGELQTALGTLTIYGVSKSDVGTSSNFAASKGCVSDTLKRCAVQWGIGRYLYSLPVVWETLDEHGRIPADRLARLRQALRLKFPLPTPAA